MSKSHKTKEQLALEADRLATVQLLADRLNVWMLQIVGQVVKDPGKRLGIAERLMDEFEIKPIWPDAMTPTSTQDTRQAYTLAPAESEGTTNANEDPALRKFTDNNELPDSLESSRCPICNGSGNVCAGCDLPSGSCTCMARVVNTVGGKVVGHTTVSSFVERVCGECGGSGKAVSE